MKRWKWFIPAGPCHCLPSISEHDGYWLGAGIWIKLCQANRQSGVFLADSESFPTALSLFPHKHNRSSNISCTFFNQI